MNLRERCQTVFQAKYQFGQNSFRTLARKTKLSKSSVHRLYHRIIKRNQHPESSLWETSEGQEWLRLLVLATIFIFALQGGIGCERLSQFFHLLRLHRHLGVSPTALRSLRARMESTIIEYQQQQNDVIGKISSDVEVCLAADETFFDEVILVMLDLPSGYIFVEEITEDCQYETWQQRVSQIFQPLGLKVKYLVSDRAKAIIKLALNDLGTNSISDLFHVLYDLNRSIGFELNRLGSRLEKQISKALLNQSKPEIINEA
ncbi:MAG: transposase family protein [Pleurocapsa sp. CRU_1_2]|nr:transposase family protein [Pleurocapsa sp. CRU_1_2]